jgi:hypothetical protein
MSWNEVKSIVGSIMKLLCFGQLPKVSGGKHGGTSRWSRHDTQRARSVATHEPAAPEINHFLHPSRREVMSSVVKVMTYRPVLVKGKFDRQILSQVLNCTCTYDIRGKKLARRVCSVGCRSHTCLTSVIQTSTAWVLGEQGVTTESIVIIIIGGLDKMSGKGGVHDMLGGEGFSMYSHILKVDPNANFRIGVVWYDVQ